jgi:succinate dehydrogenase / fumarate reductase cytochrome b subunit
MIASQRPKYLDLARIRQPVPAVISILHRISGGALFLFAWALLYLLQESLSSPEVMAFSLARRPLVRQAVPDRDAVGITASFFRRAALAAARRAGFGRPEAGARTSWMVLGMSLILTLILGVCIW